MHAPEDAGGSVAARAQALTQLRAADLVTHGLRELGHEVAGCCSSRARWSRDSWPAGGHADAGDDLRGLGQDGAHRDEQVRSGGGGILDESSHSLRSTPPSRVPTLQHWATRAPADGPHDRAPASAGPAAIRRACRHPRIRRAAGELDRRARGPGLARRRLTPLSRRSQSDRRGGAQGRRADVAPRSRPPGAPPPLTSRR